MKSVFAVVIVVILFIGGLFIFSQKKADVPAFPPGSSAMSSSTALAENSESVVSVVDSSRQVPAGFLEYKNSAYHFSVLYPNILKVKEYPEKNTALTVTFLSDDETKEFQVFVTPYGATDISKERFKLDEPSGVMLEPTQIVVGQSPATMFFSENAIMGKTREVWFVKSSLLYEVTTIKENDAWLGEIMKSWLFM